MAIEQRWHTSDGESFPTLAAAEAHELKMFSALGTELSKYGPSRLYADPMSEIAKLAEAIGTRIAQERRKTPGGLRRRVKPQSEPEAPGDENRAA